MAEKQILCAYGIDIDAVAGWLGSYGGEGVSTFDLILRGGTVVTAAGLLEADVAVAARKRRDARCTSST